jgi:hypothetical protein
MSLEGLSEEDIKALERELLTKLDAAGGAAGNISLMRELEWEEDTYWSVRDRLVDAGQVELGKGKGGSVHRVGIEPVAPEDEPRQPTIAVTDEEKLYEPLAKVLREDWVKDNRFRESLVEITAKQGKRDTGGKWSRPDITVVGMTTYVYVPGRHFDVATFEVKPFDGIDVTAVYEALAHRRAATRAYVIFHVPDEQREAVEVLLDQISDEAKRHGIGLIVIGKPDDYESWDERVEAIRIDPAPERLNDFIAVQLSDGAKQEIVQWFK